jgi:arginyl-tRNA synthetase
MVDVAGLLEARLQAAFDTLAPGSDPVLRPSDHGDFQANGALPLAKVLGRAPREVASAVVAASDLEEICAAVEIAGPGFINLTLDRGFLEGALSSMADDPRLGIEEVAHPERVVVDYSAPNVAKEMHVGHLRTTCIGDAICRLLGFVGHEVVRENHIGDWGTPFGMLIEHLVDLGEDRGVEALSVGDLTGFYQAARKSFDADPAFADRSRARVVALQAGDPDTLRLWRVLVAESVAYFNEVYRKLGVLLTDDDLVGESFYNPMLPAVVADLRAAGLLRENDGAQCVFPEGFTNREGAPLPLIVQKSDGGFGYAATDLAAIRDRVERIGADRMLYVVGAEQSQHLEMCFAVARLAGWLPDRVHAEHIAHGIVLGEDHKRLRTRAGDTVKLVALLDEAIERAEAAVVERSGAFGGEELREVAEAIGIGAVKYADLSTDRERDYVFDLDRMLAFDGDTGPYLQYAHARIRSVLRRAEEEGIVPSASVVVTEPAERALGIALIGLPGAIAQAAQSARPNRLCSHLLVIATRFTAFYEHCPILRAELPQTRAERAKLATVTARALALGLGLLGIVAPERM